MVSFSVFWYRLRLIIDFDISRIKMIDSGIRLNGGDKTKNIWCFAENTSYKI